MVLYECTKDTLIHAVSKFTTPNLNKTAENDYMMYSEFTNNK